MALSEVLKKYAEEAREGIMQKIPETDRGIVPYKTTSSSYPVYNLNSDTVEEKQTLSYEPVGIMAQPEGKPISIQPPFMPSPDREFKPEQPFVTGPTGVISYGTTEEGTPRLLTDYRTGETTYADTGEPYTPPPVEPEEPTEPEEPIVDPCPPGYQLVDGVCQPIPQEQRDRDDRDEPFANNRTNNQKGRDSLKNFGIKLTGGEDSIFADPKKTKDMFGEERKLPTFTADDFETGIPNLGPLTTVANILGKTFIGPSTIKNLEKNGLAVKTGNTQNGKDEYKLSENGVRAIVQAEVDDDTPRMERELRKQGFTQEEIDSGKALAKMREDDSDFYPDRPKPNLSFGTIKTEELPPIDPSIDATDAVTQSGQFDKQKIKDTRLEVEAERQAALEEAERMKRLEAQRQEEKRRQQEAERDRLRQLDIQRKKEAAEAERKRKEEELKRKRQLEELERRRKVEKELAEKTRKEKEELQERKRREKEQKSRLGYGENIDQDIIDANKKDANREAQKQSGDPDMRAVTDRYGNPVRDSKGNVVLNPKPKKDSGGGGDSDKGGDKIVCTMMNESYGFGSFRNKVWLAQSKNLSKEYQIGYHALFLPLVNYAKQKGFTNTIVKNTLEHIARHRTVDIRKQQYNKVDVLGRTYRTILEPLCYITGRIKLWKKK